VSGVPWLLKNPALRTLAGSPSLRVSQIGQGPSSLSCEPKMRSPFVNALSTSSRYGDQQGSADGGSVTKSMSRSTAPTSAGSRSA
jgi:hypothetical protein